MDEFTKISTSELKKLRNYKQRYFNALFNQLSSKLNEEFMKNSFWNIALLEFALEILANLKIEESKAEEEEEESEDETNEDEEYPPQEVIYNPYEKQEPEILD